MKYIIEAIVRMGLLQLLIEIYKSQGREGVERMLTIPEQQIKKITDKSGANFEDVIRERNQSRDETLDFIEKALNVDIGED